MSKGKSSLLQTWLNSGVISICCKSFTSVVWMFKDVNILSRTLLTQCDTALFAKRAFPRWPFQRFCLNLWVLDHCKAAFSSAINRILLPNMFSIFRLSSTNSFSNILFWNLNNPIMSYINPIHTSAYTATSHNSLGNAFAPFVSSTRRRVPQSSASRGRPNGHPTITFDLPRQSRQGIPMREILSRFNTIDRWLTNAYDQVFASTGLRRITLYIRASHFVFSM